MIEKLSIAKPFADEPKKYNICPECGDAQKLKWDSSGDGKNITLTTLRHEKCYEKYWKNIKDFDYEVNIKEKKFQEVA